METRSTVRDEQGNITAVDINDGYTTTRWETYGPSDDCPRHLIGEQDHEDGHFRPCDGTDIFGNPLYED